ncbi:tRNA threonylcarbamoyladenosine biosynthesis protein TsaE [Porphyridium purpureum]|uniref:tRNA threonylcarbamoyladenosine biosynthesis protein TsaE n=1 Tax=Porphyridium purpureum TaxID=35688 RepID=A0A5J4Z3D2_PORPP|nr:tRNA threonylcarbamoyladenosine biosynthesis protein TsaE [Porphyridium purpureum]|eukprot:POR8171..scf295_1
MAAFAVLASLRPLPSLLAPLRCGAMTSIHSTRHAAWSILRVHKRRMARSLILGRSGSSDLDTSAELNGPLQSSGQVATRGVRVANLNAMEALAAHLASLSVAGDCFLVEGEMGCGKTAFVRCYIRAFMRDPSWSVTSPTFLLDVTHDAATAGNPVQDSIVIHHMDLWRLEAPVNRTFADLDTIFKREISLIEWPDRLDPKMLPEQRLHVKLSFAEELPDLDRMLETGELDSDESRYVHLEAHGERWVSRLEQQIRPWLERCGPSDGIEMLSKVSPEQELHAPE